MTVHYEQPGDPTAQRQALSLLLTGRLDAPASAVEPFMSYVRSQHVSLTQLWWAWSSGQAVGAALLVPGRGRAGMVFISPLPSGSGVEAQTMPGLLDRVMHSPAAGNLRLVQALLEPGQRVEQAVLSRAGFKPLATLRYLHRAADRRAASRASELPTGLRLTPWTGENRPLFERAILASYQQTLDCPGLLGLRTIDDIIEGHMATGEFDPALWHVVSRGEESVAVLLLARLAAQRAMELVYLGVSPTARHQGLGRLLLHHALAMTRSSGLGSLMLAVDEANTPAVQLYERAGFIEQARRLALMRIVEQAVA